MLLKLLYISVTRFLLTLTISYSVVVVVFLNSCEKKRTFQEDVEEEVLKKKKKKQRVQRKKPKRNSYDMGKFSHNKKRGIFLVFFYVFGNNDTMSSINRDWNMMVAVVLFVELFNKAYAKRMGKVS